MNEFEDRVTARYHSGPDAGQFDLLDPSRHAYPSVLAMLVWQYGRRGGASTASAGLRAGDRRDLGCDQPRRRVVDIVRRTAVAIGSALGRVR